MGSGRTEGVATADLGIIPRVIGMIFSEVENRKHKAEFLVKCSFLEIYNEELHDLLDPLAKGSSKDIAVREEKNGTISVYGLQEEKVSNYEELA